MCMCMASECSFVTSMFHPFFDTGLPHIHGSGGALDLHSRSAMLKPLLIAVALRGIACLRVPTTSIPCFQLQRARVLMSEMFPLPPDATLDQCMKHSSRLCGQLSSRELTDPDIELGPLAAFLIAGSAADTISQLQACNEPLGGLLQEEARTLRLALLQRLAMMNSMSALQRLALVTTGTPAEADLARWDAACDAWGYGAEDLEELLDKLEPAAAVGEKAQ